MKVTLLALAIWPFSHPTHLLTVLDGVRVVSTQNITSGTVIALSASPCPDGDTFSWTIQPANGGSFANANDPQTRFTMGKVAVTIGSTCGHTIAP